MARGIDVWFDRWEIVGSDNFAQKMAHGIQRCHGALLLLGDRALEGSWTEREYQAWLARQVEPESRVEHAPKPLLIPIEAHERR
ncbi:MAG: hypothetical protein RL033_4385 [Pseudomonadota bacterium]